jgi:diguanylate cyclase (GGDEF)-like protein
MSLDLNTLFVVTTYVEVLLGFLLLFVWVQNTKTLAVAWWGAAHLMRAGSLALFGRYGSAPELISIDLANAVLFMSYAATWMGARIFSGRSPQPALFFGGAALWLFLCRMPLFTQSMDARVLLSAGIIAAYTWMAAIEFWRGRGENLVSRWPAISLLIAHGALFLLRTPLSTALPWLPKDLAFESVWLTALSLEALLFTISISFILLAMAKERIELQHRADALIDPLTGIGNRRAIIESSLDPGRRSMSRPEAVLLIDLDHFKSINDRFGHAIGDRVLQLFAATAVAGLGPFDRVGRLGGEEFAIVLHDAGREKALATAERLRVAFSESAATVDGRTVAATISIGVALSDVGQLDVEAMLAQADQALYLAKEHGRDRVEIASLDTFIARGEKSAAQTAA